MPGLGVEGGLPLLVEPLAAHGGDQAGDVGHVLAPAGLAAQAHAVDAAGLVRELVGELADLLVGGLVGHGEPGLLEQVGAVVRHGALGVERQGVELAVHGEAVAHGAQQVALVVGGGQVVERQQPALLGPDRHLVVADGEQVEGAGLHRHVLGDAAAQGVLVQHHPLQVDVGVLLLELGGESLHHHHVAVVHGGDGEGRVRRAEAGRTAAAVASSAPARPAGRRGAMVVSSAKAGAGPAPGLSRAGAAYVKRAGSEGRQALLF